MKTLFKSMLLLSIVNSSSVWADNSLENTANSALESAGESVEIANKEAVSNALSTVQQRWAQVNYQLFGDAQHSAFDELMIQIDNIVKANPNDAKGWIWQGIIKSSYAGAKGGLGALSLAEQAKESLEKALMLDELALSGSAYTSLGTLYHKVPGWPIGFGDDDKAKTMLGKAVELNPTGIDPNYFYAEFWYDERKYSKAKHYLVKAKSAPARVNRPLADQARHQEINSLMVKVDKKLKKKKT